MNKVLKILLLSDVLIISGFGLITPIFAIYLNDYIQGGTIAAIGIASTIYLLTQSIFQIFVSKYTDTEKGNKRELYTLIVGSLIFTLAPIIYIYSTNIWHIYLAQFVSGLGAAISYPGWRVLYTRFLDKNREGYEWSIYDTSVNLGSAATAAIGGFIAQVFGFKALFFLVAVLSVLGTVLLGNLFKKEIINNQHKKRK